MKLKASAIAMLFGLSATAAWAADAVHTPDDANQAQATGNAASSSNEEQTGWQYLNGQAATSEAAGSDEQSANDESSSRDDRAAKSEDSGDVDQAANAQDASDGDQSADAEAASGNDQAAESEDTAGSDQTASSEIRPVNFRPASLEDFKAATQDKLVVILPAGWQGSVPHLIAALEEDSDASEILILSQDENEDSDSQ
jgi:hypothetical protein